MGQTGCLNSSTGGVQTSRCFVGLCFNKHSTEAQWGWNTLRSSTEVWPLLENACHWKVCVMLLASSWSISQVSDLKIVPDCWAKQSGIDLQQAGILVFATISKLTFGLTHSLMQFVIYCTPWSKTSVKYILCSSTSMHRFSVFFFSH